jgi:uncharacterized membrane protein YfcA
VGLVLGTLRLPLLVLLGGNPASAAGANIAISAAAAASGAARHAREGRVDWRVAAWMTPPSVAGAVLGSLWADELPERVLLGTIAAVLAWSGADLILNPVRERRARPGPSLPPAVGLGFGIGLLGGAVGVILGTLRMPALLRAVGLTARRAVGTNLVVGFALGLAGFATYAAQLEVEWGLLAAGLAGALPGGWLGSRITGRVSEVFLRRAIGAALLGIAAAFSAQVALA